ncbi:MAG: DUF4105 domain-containing protein [Bacteroidales bacterium]|nr:DUF4105 domain-containing protein [Bacteroidales bacterium]
MKTKLLFPVRLLALWLLSLPSAAAFATQTASATAEAAPPLDENAVVSLVTCAPGNEVWAHYGHSAIRVRDGRRDLCFNYGIFDFGAPHFLWRFISGQTNYILGVSRTKTFMDEYRAENRPVSEQTLHLMPSEKEALWQALWTNSLPENRTYRYNFIYDNCATRSRIIIERQLAGTVAYDSTLLFPTLREAVRHYTRPHPWTWLGICLLLGSPADRPATFSELLFAPDVMEKAFATAWIGPEVLSDSCDCLPLREKAEPLVAQTRRLVESRGGIEGKTRSWPGPTAICWIVSAVVLLICYSEYRQRKVLLLPDLLIFGTAGLAGVIIAFLAFFSLHPLVQHNWLLLWLHPLQLCLAIGLCSGKLRRSLPFRCWLWLQLGLCLFALAGGLFLPQYYHPAFYPLILCLVFRLLTRLLAGQQS